MDLRTEILGEHSRAQSEKIARWVGNSSKRYAELMQLFLNEEYRICQRAAWILSVVAEKHTDMAQPHLPAMVKKMSEPGVPVAVKRNVVRILQFVDIPESLHGDVMNICFELLGDLRETIAVRVFSMTVLARLAKIYPDIGQELRIIIEDELSNQPSAGFKSRAKKLLADL
jgi:hypothetical protein